MRDHRPSNRGGLYRINHSLLRPLARHRTPSLFLFAILVWALAAPASHAGEIEAPEVHAGVVLQAEIFSEGDGSLLTSFGQEKSRYAVRHAVIGVEGVYGDYVEYGLEAGVASCSGNMSFKLMEAGVFFRPVRQFRLGLMQGHVLRGYNLHDECVDLLTAEKTVFAQTLAPCHPTGAVAEVDIDLKGSAGVKCQLGYFNGEGGNFDENHDLNFGVLYSTPWPGLSLSGYYNDVAIKTGNDPETYEALYGSGYRAGFGAEFSDAGIHIRGEYYLGRGFSNVGGFVIPWENDPNNWANNPQNPEYQPNPDLWSYEDHEMSAYYVEGGYRIGTGFAPIPSVQPYLRYQWWDKCANLDDPDGVHAFITLGLNLAIGSDQASFRIDYESQIGRPDDRIVPDDPSHDYLSKEASRLIIRLQAGL